MTTTLKLECACGTRFAFDVEPEAGRMPTPVACPGCGSDMTAAADAILGARAIAATPVQSLRVSQDASDEPPLTGRAAAVAGAMRAVQDPAPTRRVAAYDAGDSPALWRMLKLGAVAGVVAIGVWVWYAAFASQPKVALALSASPENPFRYAHLLGRDRFVVVTATEVSVREIAGGKAVWTSALQKDEQPEIHMERGGVSFVADAVAEPVSGSLWVVLRKKAVRFDLASGRRLKEVPFSGEPEKIITTDGALLGRVLSPQGGWELTRIDTGSGEASTRALSPTILSKNGGVSALDEIDSAPSPGGATSLAFALRESRFVTKDGVAKQSRAQRAATPLIDRENLRAADSMPAVNEFLQQRTGGPVEFDESTYQAVVFQPFARGVEWTAEVVGRPGIYPTRDLTLMSAGTNLYAFDAANALKWSVPLTYPASPEALSGDAIVVAGAGSRLFFADIGTVTSLDPRTGQAAWRLPTVGTHEIMMTGPTLYVATTSAGPELIRPGEGLRDDSRTHPVLMKVDAASGRVLWQADRVQAAIPAGKWLYGYWAGTSMLDAASAAMNQTEARAVLSLYRLDPATGKQLWFWHDQGAPKQVEAFETRVLIRRQTELKIVSFFSF
jgi:PQQ-like domain